MKGQRLPPHASESQPQMKATTMKIPVVMLGTMTSARPQIPGWTIHTIVDLRYREGNAGDGRRMFVEALQPVAHGSLRLAVVPNDVQQGEEVSMPAQQDPLGLGPRPGLLASAPNSLHPLH
jgi:hypothetical protein